MSEPIEVARLIRSLDELVGPHSMRGAQSIVFGVIREWPRLGKVRARDPAGAAGGQVP